MTRHAEKELQDCGHSKEYEWRPTVGDTDTITNLPPFCARCRLERLTKQALAISTMLSDAGIGPMPIEEAVRHLVTDVEHIKSEQATCRKHADPLVCLACEAEEDARPEWRKPHRVTPPRLRGEPPRTPEYVIAARLKAFIREGQGMTRRDHAEIVKDAENADDALGLSIDMLDVDRLRDWARLLLVHGSDISHWASVPHVASKLQTIATGIEKAIHDIGRLRSLLPTEAPKEPTDAQVNEAIDKLAERVATPKAGFVNGDLYCYGGCGTLYSDFPCDLLLPTPLWNRIAVGFPFNESFGRKRDIATEGRGGVLCPSCIIARLAALPDCTVVFADIKPLAAPEPLKALVAKWRAHGAGMDTLHATMGIGWKVCADELEAHIAEAVSLPPSPWQPNG